MRVARLYGAGDVRVDDEPDPVSEPDCATVRVTAVGLCGSDLHWFTEGGIGDARLTSPLVLGHEFAGVVEGGPLDGRRVAVDPAITCLSCPQCFEGNHNLCTRMRFAGHGGTDGGLRQRLAWPGRLLHPLPDQISDSGGAMLEPLGVAVHAVDLAHLRVGASVAVVGCGPIGLLLIQVVRAAGATSVVAIDPLAHRREAARRFGADAAVTPDEAGTADFAAVTPGGDVDVAFEAAGSDAALASAISLVRPGARVVLGGIPVDDSHCFGASVARRKGLTLVMVRRMKDAYPRAIRLVQRGLVDVDSVISDRFPLERVYDAFTSAVARDGLKVIIEP